MKPAVPEHQYESGCMGKQGFKNPAVAREITRRTRQRRDARVEVYKCACCGMWHIGNSNKR